MLQKHKKYFQVGPTLMAGWLCISSNAMAAPSSTEISQKLDQYMSQVCAHKYTVEGAKTKPVKPAFRLPAYTPSAKDASKKIMDVFVEQGTWKAELNNKVVKAVYGRASCEEIFELTQQLIDAGQLPSMDSTEESIRKLMRDFGIGMDCQGYVSYAVPYALQKSAASLGMTDSQSGRSNIKLTEGLYRKISNPGDIQSGDIIYLKSTNPEEPYDHTVVVYQKSPMSDRFAHLINNHPVLSLLGSTIFVIEVDSSWGGGIGVFRKTWLYETTTKQWAQISSNGLIAINRDCPIAEHEIQGIYRSR